MIADSINLFFVFPLVLIVAAISWIDIKTYRIPDVLNLTLFVLGTVFVILEDSMDLVSQVQCALAIGFILWAVRFAFFHIRNKNALGLGDVKMGAASGMWIYLENLPLMFLIASGSALVTILGLRLFGGNRFASMNVLPFGPYIGFSLLVVWSIQVSLVRF